MLILLLASLVLISASTRSDKPSNLRTRVGNDSSSRIRNDSSSRVRNENSSRVRSDNSSRITDDSSPIVGTYNSSLPKEIQRPTKSRNAVRQTMVEERTSLDGIPLGSSTSPPVSVFTGENFEELFVAFKQPQARSILALSSGRQELAADSEPTLSSSDGKRVSIHDFVSHEEKNLIINLCSYYAGLNLQRLPSEGERSEDIKMCEVGLGILDQLLTTFENITKRVVQEVKDPEQMEVVKKGMEEMRIDIHSHKSNISEIILNIQ